MNFLETMLSRNEQFAQDGFDADLKMMPSERTLFVGCVDPRVDPDKIFGLEAGEAAVFRNVGGRVSPALIETISLLRSVTQAVTGNPAVALNLVVLHHTDCGIRHCRDLSPDLLAKHLGVALDQLDELAIDDPYRSVEIDVATLRANLDVPGGYIVSGLVYDVASGKVETVVPPAPLRSES